jgi:hypothetical protein
MTNPYESFTQKIQHAVVQVGATSGDQTLVAAPGAGKNIWLMGYRLVAQTAVNVQFKDTAGSTHSGTFHLGDLGELAEPVSPYPVAKLLANKGLVLNLSAAQLVGGYVTYRIVG